MTPRPFAQIDVFTDTPGYGNPVAVVLDGSGLDDAAMQRFARWTNLSETTFVLPPTHPGADYRLRIFTPGGELPFAGHPTLGSCHAWLAAGGRPKGAQVVQESAIGLVSIARDGQRLAFAAPPSTATAIEEDRLGTLCDALGLARSAVLQAQLLNNGPAWHALQLESRDAVLALQPDHARLAALGTKAAVFSIASPSPSADTPSLEVRAFAAPIGVPEDPVTGSLNASLAQWLMRKDDMPTQYLAAQGTALGRAGRVYLRRDDAGQVWVGGDSVTVVQGQVLL